MTFRIGPLSAIKHPKGSYDTDSQPDVGEVDEGKFLPAKELSIGFRDDDSSTLSMKYFKLNGRCASFNAGDGNRVEIKNFYTCPVYSTDVSFSENLGAYDHLVSYTAQHIDPQPPTNIMPPQRMLTNKKDENVFPALKHYTTAFCWDSGAAVNTIPQSLVSAWKLGTPAGKGKAIIHEISVLTSNRHELLRFINVPVDTDSDLYVIGAPILNLFNIGIDPTGGKLGLSILEKGLWKSEILDFGQKDNATFLAPW